MGGVLVHCLGSSYPGNPVHDIGHVGVVHLAYQQPANNKNLEKMNNRQLSGIAGTFQDKK